MFFDVVDAISSFGSLIYISSAVILRNVYNAAASALMSEKRYTHTQTTESEAWRRTATPEVLHILSGSSMKRTGYYFYTCCASLSLAGGPRGRVIREECWLDPSDERTHTGPFILFRSLGCLPRTHTTHSHSTYSPDLKPSTTTTTQLQVKSAFKTNKSKPRKKKNKNNW